MQRIQAFRYPLMPNGEQQRAMRRFAGACRFVYNQGLALQQERHQQGEKKLSAFALNKLPKQKVVKPRRAASRKQEPTEATALGFAP